MLKTLEAPKAKVRTYRSPGQSDVKVERIVVTPEVAQAWLDKNIRNRRLTGRHVEKLARDMRNGNFAFSGDAIRFDVDGILIDGQHRLHACVKAAVPFETFVIYGLAPEVQDRIDAGKSRNAGDVMSLSGLHNTNHLAAACRLLLVEKEGFADPGTLVASTADVLGILERHKELPSVLNETIQRRLPRGISIPRVATVVYVGRHLMNFPVVANAYLSVMSTGIPYYEGDAAHYLRERLLRSVTATSVIRKRDAWKLYKHAWNHFSTQQKIHHLRIPEEVPFVGLDYKLL